MTQTKFDREVDQLRNGAERFRQKGVFLLDAGYPTVLVGFAAPQLTPPALVVAVRFDYSDFDLKPPSRALTCANGSSGPVGYALGTH